MGPLLASFAWLIGERPLDAAFALSWAVARAFRHWEDRIQPRLVPQWLVRRRADRLEATCGHNALTMCWLEEDWAEGRGHFFDALVWFRVSQELQRRARRRRQRAEAAAPPGEPPPPLSILDSPPSPALYPSRLAGTDPPHAGAE